MKLYDFKFAIIGAGFGGIIAALELRKNKFDSLVIFEKASELGGTWRDNVYPGCACDVSSYLYSIHDVPNPNWSKMYATQSEILAYLKDVVKTNNLEQKVTYNTEIVQVEFDQDNLFWKLTSSGEKTYTAKYVFLAQGPLNRAVIPKFTGLDQFKGNCFHTSNWDKTVDLANKKVAIVGTGASAIQVIPNIVDQVKHLYVLQRTAAWILPRKNEPISEFAKKVFRRFPFIEKLKREQLFWTNEFFGLAFVGNQWVNKIVTNFALSYLKRKITNPELQKKLIPNYKLGCKRILISKSYYPIFNRKNVELLTDAIAEIKANSIRLQDGKEIEVDVIIMATGFEAAELQVKTRIIGLDQVNLIDRWNEEGVSAYKGSITRNYPNLFFILGPNTGLGHNSVLHMMESQMRYIMQFIKQSEKLNNKEFLNVKVAVEKAYNSTLQRNFTGTVWSSGCKSWYMNSKGVNTTIYPRLNSSFRREMNTFSLDSFQIDICR